MSEELVALKELGAVLLHWLLNCAPAGGEVRDLCEAAQRKLVKAAKKMEVEEDDAG